MAWPYPELSLATGDHANATQGATGPSHMQAADAWGQHLHQYDWSHFVTLTPRFPDYSAERLVRGFRDGFIRRLAHVIQGPIPWFYALERSPAGVFHLHALLARAERASIAQVRAAWQLGFTDAGIYDPPRRGAWYVTKTLGLPPAGFERWDASSRLPRKRRRDTQEAALGAILERKPGDPSDRLGPRLRKIAEDILARIHPGRASSGRPGIRSRGH
jgi:hypothetical protein